VIPDSRRVHSVGFVGWSAGGVVEVVARSEMLFVADLVPSGGGVPRSAAMECPSSSRSQILGSIRMSYPSWIPSGGGSGHRIWRRRF
jgi:hypothetical protein